MYIEKKGRGASRAFQPWVGWVPSQTRFDQMKINKKKGKMIKDNLPLAVTD